MPVCTDGVRWEMELVVEGASDSDKFTFYIIKLVNEVIEGEVHDINGNITPLSGRCSPLVNEPDVSSMRFDFNVLGSSSALVRVLMAGIAHQPDDPDLKPLFAGAFVAVPPIAGAASGLPLPTLIDVGDTGTGNGNQT